MWVGTDGTLLTMQYHQIPQHVTGYEGRIIGKFTARQFTYLAMGAIVIFILAGSPIPKEYKFLLGFFVAAVSAGFALINYEGRSTDIWIAHFLRAVFSPTQRIWTKEEIPPRYLLPSYKVLVHRKETKKKTGEELEHFLEFWGGAQRESGLTVEEEQFLRKLKWKA